MTIAPIRHVVDVKAPPPRAFDLFATRISDWWPRGTTIGKKPHVQIVIEPREGGRWFERDEDGAECDWGKVLAWDPPQRLLLGWQLNTQWRLDPDLLTEVELNFSALPGGGTRVSLEHRNLERFGADAAAHVEKLKGGWPSRLSNYATWVDAL